MEKVKVIVGYGNLNRPTLVYDVSGSITLGCVTSSGGNESTLPAFLNEAREAGKYVWQ